MSALPSFLTPEEQALLKIFRLLNPEERSLTIKFAQAANRRKARVIKLLPAPRI